MIISSRSGLRYAVAALRRAPFGVASLRLIPFARCRVARSLPLLQGSLLYTLHSAFRIWALCVVAQQTIL
jgi:hypothetical protein